jgi:deazaflavin-dependent oxidoreductase (nitroreductase family)
MTRLFIQLHIALYRLTGGALGGNLIVARILLLTTIGRRSGQPRTTPLRYLPYGEAYLIAASNWGKPNPPAWFYNIRANPVVTLQVMDRRMTARAEVAPDALHDELYARFMAADHSFERYPVTSGRTIPVVILRPAVEST